MLEDVNNYSSVGFANLDFSATGTFVYVGAKGESQRAIFWLDSAGKTQPLFSAPGLFAMSPRFSPDGKHLAFAMDTRQARMDVWVQDLERGTTSRLTSLLGVNGWPVWTPDGKNIVFARTRAPPRGLFWIRADGSGEAQRLTDGKLLQSATSFSPDGKRLAYFQPGPHGNSEIWTASVEGDNAHPRLGKAEPFLRTQFISERDPVFSPDGRWLAYSSDETGIFEVYVRPFPGPGSKSQISTGGGQLPIWSRASELFFVSNDHRIMVAGYTVKGDTFAAGRPTEWSQKSLSYVSADGCYDLAPGGNRFAVVQSPGGTAAEEQKPIDSVTVLLNFFDELRRRVPARGK